MANLKFTEQEIQSLFGHEAAEDEDPDRLREYYFKSATYDQIVTELPLRVLVGHKGIGKSALFRYAISEYQEEGKMAIELRPDDIAELTVQPGDFLNLIRSWKVGLRTIITQRAARTLRLSQGAVADALRDTGSVIDALLETVRSTGANSSVDRAAIDRFVLNPELTVFIDDLDRGWEGRKEDVRRISALLNSVRDLVKEDRGLKFRISLRSDVYFLVRTSDESTDKIEGSVIWQSWTNHDIFVVLVKRIETFFGRSTDSDRLRMKSQFDLAQYLIPVMDDTFRGRGHWRNAPIHRVLMSLTRKRPRDLVKLCSLAARDAHGVKSSKIYTPNFESVFEEYSQGRVQDTINEYRSELPEVDRLILSMKPTVKEKTAKAGYVYTTDELVKKIKDIQEQGKFRFKSGKPASDKDLASFMYKINFLTARRENPNNIVRKYFEEQRYLQNDFVDFGFDWEVHPAYRWALQPGDINAIFDSLKLSSE
jgi:hypothetical protein